MLGSMRLPECSFCPIISDLESNVEPDAIVVAEWPDAIAILPRECDDKRGCVDGHTLVIPRLHVPDAAADPLVTAVTMARAAELAANLDDFNIITSKGKAATQTVFHLHLHVIPRVEGDGLALPWGVAA